MTSEAISMLPLCCVCHDSSLLSVVHNTGEYADKCGYENCRAVMCHRFHLWE